MIGMSEEHKMQAGEVILANVEGLLDTCVAEILRTNPDTTAEHALNSALSNIVLATLIEVSKRGMVLPQDQKSGHPAALELGSAMGSAVEKFFEMMPCELHIKQLAYQLFQIGYQQA